MEPSSCIELTARQQVRLLGIARQSIALGFGTRQPMPVDQSELEGLLGDKLASFVTLRQGGALRGCVGSVEATHPLAASAAIAAFKAAFEDHRFPPLVPAELDQTQIEISVLSPPEEMEFTTELEFLAGLRPGEDGLLLEEGEFRATFLPKVWEHLPEPAEFVEELKTKAGLSRDYWSDTLRIHRYRVVAFAEYPLPASALT